MRIPEIVEHAMKHQRTKRVIKRKSVKTVGNTPRRTKITKDVRETRIAPRNVNRDNTLANWVAGMTPMGTEGRRRPETLAGWGDDTI
jgi:hypothetical protein